MCLRFTVYAFFALDSTGGGQLSSVRMCRMAGVFHIEATDMDDKDNESCTHERCGRMGWSDRKQCDCGGSGWWVVIEITLNKGFVKLWGDTG